MNIVKFPGNLENEDSVMVVSTYQNLRQLVLCPYYKWNRQLYGVSRHDTGIWRVKKLK